jgi:hypothetical protein
MRRMLKSALDAKVANGPMPTLDFSAAKVRSKPHSVEKLS